MHARTPATGKTSNPEEIPPAANAASANLASSNSTSSRPAELQLHTSPHTKPNIQATFPGPHNKNTITMPSDSLAAYLAKNYLTADPPSSSSSRPKKKRKTKNAPAEETGLIIADDDPPDLRSTAGQNLERDDEFGPQVVGAGSGATGEFRRKKKSGWKTLGSAEDAEADAILADAAAEEDARRREAGDEDPMVVDQDEDEDEGGLRMESGARAGLQTAEQTAAMVAAQQRKRRAEEAKYKGKKQQDGDGGGEQETIYRDASGRIINVAMKRAEARRVEEEKKVKEAEAKEALMGDVQRQEREKRREALEEAKVMPLARTVDDEDLNDELKAQSRWNDPAAQFLTKGVGKDVSRTGKPLYKGAFQPNRYGIRPGHRWDGVDRGNGFEKEWFAARNRKGRMEALEYEWQMD
ncbi:Pre-mRNA-splicing factor of RES complex-domain-containing protein, partial [Aspergillus karnatakaensis]|uniref:putative cell cycle control protein (Cwf26) n=1 Tax=Aspergillus karnatakaensis TaxID=1810916 RepID=UPI003CCCE136